MGFQRKARRAGRRSRVDNASFDMTPAAWLAVVRLRGALEEMGLTDEVIDLPAWAANGKNPLNRVLADLGLTPVEACVLLATSETVVPSEIQLRMVRAGASAETIGLDDAGIESMVRASVGQPADSAP
jgi:hypothetical protein